jgi:predicted ATP-binding protein involved in virulence
MAEQYLEQCFEYLQELDEHKTLKNRFRLEKLDLVDFRRFEHLEVKLHPELTVLIGDNGSGKTSILEAISKTLSNIANEILKGANGKELSRSDVNNAPDKKFTDVKTIFSYGLGLKSLEAKLSIAKAGKYPSYLEDLKRIGRLWLSVDRFNEVNLPMLTYYSDKRNCQEKKSKNNKQEENESRFNAYKDAVGEEDFVEWYIGLQKRVSAGDVISQKHLSNIDSVICSAIEMNQIRLDMSTGKDVVWFKTENGADVRFEQMSAGQKALTALFGDIARRLILLNPKLDNPLEGQGIVLIDEIELHLHPKWQQGVLLNLQKSFPNIQFIVTTHSPQVLSTVDKSCIRKFTTNERGEDILETPKFQTKGVMSADILAYIMDGSPTPSKELVKETGLLNDYHALIQQNLHQKEKGVSLKSQLIDHFGREHPIMRECERMERLQLLKVCFPIPSKV